MSVTSRNTLFRQDTTARTIAILALLLSFGAMSVGFGYGISNLLHISTNQQKIALIGLSSVYVNAATGYDTSVGSVTSPVATIQQAIDLMSVDGPVQECIIQLQGVGPFLLGTGTVSFFPMTERCGHIIIRGEKANVISDTVQSIYEHGPWDGWRGIEGTTGGYPSGVYSSHFVHNIDQDIYYVVMDNNSTFIDTITGDLSTYSTFEGDSGGLITRSNAWHVGEIYEAYTIQSVVTFSNVLVLNVPTKKVTFEAIHLAPAEQSTLSAPRGAIHRTVFKGCKLDITTNVPDSISEILPAFIGSYSFEGVYANGTVPNSAMSVEEQDRCIVSDSMWINESRLMYTDTCHAYFLYSTGATRDASVAVRSGFFRGFGLKLTGQAGVNSLLFTGHTDTLLYRVEIECITCTTPTGTTIGINFIDGSGGRLVQLSVINPALRWAVVLQKGSNVFFKENLHLVARTALRITGPAAVEINSGTNMMELESNSGPAIFMQTSALLTFRSVGGNPIFRTTANEPVVELVADSKLIFYGGNIGQWFTPHTTLMQLRDGSTLIERASGSITNSGTGGNLAIIGALSGVAIVTQDDYTSINTKYCKLLIV